MPATTLLPEKDARLSGAMNGFGLRVAKNKLFQDVFGPRCVVRWVISRHTNELSNKLLPLPCARRLGFYGPASGPGLVATASRGGTATNLANVVASLEERAIRSGVCETAHLVFFFFWKNKFVLHTTGAHPTLSARADRYRTAG